MTLSHMHNIKRTFFACSTVSRLLLCSFPEAFHVKIWAYISQPVAVSKGLMTNLKYSRKIKVFFVVNAKYLAGTSKSNLVTRDRALHPKFIWWQGIQPSSALSIETIPSSLPIAKKWLLGSNAIDRIEKLLRILQQEQKKLPETFSVSNIVTTIRPTTDKKRVTSILAQYSWLWHSLIQLTD